MADRVAALNEIVRLARAHGITAAEVREAMRGEVRTAGPSVTSRILAYVGGVFLLCGLGFFIESFWNDMPSSARIVLTLGTGVVLLVLALMMVHGGRYASSGTPVFLLAALFQAGGIMVAFDELGVGGDPRHAVLATALVMLAQMLLLYRVHRLGVLLFLAFVFGAASLADFLDIVGVGWELNHVLCGVGLLAASFALRESGHAAILPFWYLAGGVLLSYGGFELLEETPVHFLYVGYAALLIWFSTVARSRTLLFVATCAMIGYLGYFTSEYFADSLGWPAALMLIGLIFIGLSVLAMKISREYIGGAA